MSRKREVRALRVVIDPKALGDYGYVITSDEMAEPDPDKRIARYRERCEGIARDVKRHVDNVGHVEIVADAEDVCEHCGAAWTEGDAPHNGGCCDRDVAVMDAAPTTGADR